VVFIFLLLCLEVLSAVVLFNVVLVEVDVNDDSKRLAFCSAGLLLMLALSPVVLFGCGAGSFLILALSPVVKMLVWLLLIVVGPLWFDDALWLLTPNEILSTFTFLALSSLLLLLSIVFSSCSQNKNN